MAGGPVLPQRLFIGNGLMLVLLLKIRDVARPPARPPASPPVLRCCRLETGCKSQTSGALREAQRAEKKDYSSCFIRYCSTLCLYDSQWTTLEQRGARPRCLTATSCSTRSGSVQQRIREQHQERVFFFLQRTTNNTCKSTYSNSFLSSAGTAVGHEAVL